MAFSLGAPFFWPCIKMNKTDQMAIVFEGEEENLFIYERKQYKFYTKKGTWSYLKKGILPSNSLQYIILN